MAETKDIHLVVIVRSIRYVFCCGTIVTMPSLLDRLAPRTSDTRAAHVGNIGKSLESAYADQAEAATHDLKILHTKSNESDFTYDGIDNCAYRAIEEIDLCIDSYMPQRVTRFSIIGYSLGGLIARFALGALESRNPSFFQETEPVNFTTFASPAIGIPNFPTVMSRITNYCGARLLSRTGEQLYATDNYHAGRPLLEIMAQPGTSFHRALLRFRYKSIYANAVNDRTVPYPTGFFPQTYKDEFAKADYLARQQVRYLDTQASDLSLGGLKLEVKSDCKYLVENVESVKPAQSAEKIAENRGLHFLPTLPFILRPATFSGLPYGLGYIVPFLMPILLPSFIVYLLFRFITQSRRSRRRIKMMTTGELATLEGQLRRVGLALEDNFEEIAEEAFPLAPDSHTSEHTDPVLSPAQKRMTDNLNAIPGLEKYLAYFPAERNSHGTIIARDTRFEGHKKGLEILKWWSGRFAF